MQNVKNIKDTIKEYIPALMFITERIIEINNNTIVNKTHLFRKLIFLIVFLGMSVFLIRFIGNVYCPSF